MRSSMKMRSLILGAVAALLLAIAVPPTSLAQGNGRGQGRGSDEWSNRSDRNRSNRDWRSRSRRSRHYNKKCGKFVNCHDARDGRIDGRGPNRSRVSNAILRNRLRNRDRNNIWRNRDRRTVRRVIVNQ